ncbi:hypothetical protein K7432_001999 [Basidiobolus ranarum]|uniref:Uncharacterized protein n=1 Tax=Basidiobolus ranarum TaxID=34480 RepID=A0ABR2X249_9FUNG
MANRTTKSHLLPSPSSTSENPSSLSSMIFDSPQYMPNSQSREYSNKKRLRSNNEPLGLLNSTQPAPLSLFSNSLEENDFDSDCTAISDSETNQPNLNSEKRLTIREAKTREDLRPRSDKVGVKSIFKRYISLPFLKTTLEESVKVTEKKKPQEKGISENPNSVETHNAESYTDERERFPLTNIRQFKNRVREFDTICSDMLFTTTTYHEKYKQLKDDFGDHQQDFHNELMTKFKEMSSELVKIVSAKTDDAETDVKQQLDLEVANTQQQIKQVAEQVGRIKNNFEEFNQKCSYLMNNQLVIQETLNELCKNGCQFNEFPIANVPDKPNQCEVILKAVPSVPNRCTTPISLANKNGTSKENVIKEREVSIPPKKKLVNEKKSTTPKKQIKKRRMLIT